MPPTEPPTEPPPFPVAEAALAYLRRRRSLLVRLARIERALRGWDTWETNALLPEDLRRPMHPPGLHREGSDGPQRLRTEELARLDGSLPSG